MNAWQKIKLPECLEKSPKAAKVPKKRFLASGPYPIVSQEKNLINGYWDKQEDVLPVERPVVIFGDHTQILKLIDFNFVVGADGVKILKPKDFLDAKYLYYFLLGNPLKALGYARHYRLLKELYVELPPLPEQKRIVAILAEAFTGIDAAIANTEKNLANARELFDSSSRSIFLAGGNWKKLKLAELMDLGWITSHLDGNHGSEYPRKAEFVSEGVPYISANCIKDGAVDLGLSKFLTPERASMLRKGIARDGDVLFAHNATVGPVALLKTESKKVILSTSLTYYRCDHRYIHPEYLAHYMRSPLFREQYEAVMGQSTRNQVPITKQRSFYHLIPSLDQQKEIANHLDSLRSETLRLETLYQQKLDVLIELKRSLLQKAFSGKLTSESAEKHMDEAVV